MATDRSYVGRTSGYSGRISAHFSNLRKGVHSSRLMQSDFNEYGIDSFVVEVLCKGCIEYIGNMESFMIRFYKPEYNTANVLTSKVDSSHGILCRFSHEWNNRWGINTSRDRVVVKEAFSEIPEIQFVRKVAPEVVIEKPIEERIEPIIEDVVVKSAVNDIPSRSGYNKLSEEVIKGIVDDYTSGIGSSRDIAKKWGVSYSIVMRYVRKAGVEYRAVSGRKKAPTS